MSNHAQGRSGLWPGTAGEQGVVGTHFTSWDLCPKKLKNHFTKVCYFNLTS